MPADIADRDALVRAWKEMGHRYLAGTLGVLILLLTLLAWRLRRSAGLVTAILALVVFQATLGAWTVTMLLELGQTPEGALLSHEALRAIHWSHRVFALVVLGVVPWAAHRTFRYSKDLALLLAVFLTLQFLLVVANVALALPLPLAAAHN